ncbi:ABC transporter substrate-binding protein [Pyrobaculum neutrophilum]|uniref:Periplasmic binding protein n=1 Tax=Pyrobaculum neutrophilum (strain DSM 2338 / JCM 9278 / NBRC 100436 / V24Sta) TaxID=444157 RepID=B1YAB0_PYRNV|nr:ABC transporter substrate-binding protein [Pyrobaculum neutrophilum]ACB39084.1 conserved hypothetical protein [Pyrobaculum neutrophilum V24Sta]
MITVGVLDGVPRRVVSLNPSVNEFLALLGVELAGRDAFSYRPAELMSVPIVGTFVDVDREALSKLRPDLAILYYPVQRHLLDAVANASKAVVAVPTPTSVDHAVAVFRFFARVFDRDEEGDRIAGIYRDLLRGAPLYDEVVAVINLGVYDLACSNSYVADALTRVGLRYVRGFPCVFKHSESPPQEALSRAHFVVYEARGKNYYEKETQFLGGKPHVVTPNDTLAHYGPSLPLDLRLVAEAVARGARWVGGTSSAVRPTLRGGWYAPYR